MLCTEIPFDNVYGINCMKGPGLFTWSGDGRIGSEPCGGELVTSELVRVANGIGVGGNCIVCSSAISVGLLRRFRLESVSTTRSYTYLLVRNGQGLIVY